MYEILQSGLFKETRSPVFGSQDIGISPRGAMDRFAFESGRILLGRHPGITTLEMILPPELRFIRDVYGVVTGARFEDSTLRNAEDQGARPVNHGETFIASAGDTLAFGEKIRGFRSYLSMLPFAKVPADPGLAGRVRGDFDKVFSWSDPEGRIRVVKGPEHRYLDQPDAFTDARWKTTQDMSDMGMRLTSDGLSLSVSLGDMISAPVSDGTVQLTPKGPIILLRHRQTVGGYPRIYNVISADVDLLAQYGPEQVLRFKEVSLDEAFRVARKRQKELHALWTRFDVPSQSRVVP